MNPRFREIIIDMRVFCMELGRNYSGLQLSPIHFKLHFLPLSLTRRGMSEKNYCSW